MPDNKIWLVWDRDSFYWDKVNLTWDQAYVMEEIDNLYKGGPIPLEEESTWKKLNDDMKERGASSDLRKKLLNVIVSVNGLEKETSREIDEDNPYVKVEHVKKVFEEAARTVRVVVQKTSP